MHRTARSAAAVALVTAATLSASGAEISAAAQVASPIGLIAYAGNVDGDYEIFVVRADGSRVRRLTDNNVDDFDPAWSPSGRRIVFERERGRNGFEDLYIVDVRSGAETPWVVTHGVDEGDPDWSPDGRWIAYRGSDGGDGADVIAMTVDRSESVIVSSQVENSTNMDPAWSPDGASLALVESYESSALYVASFCCSQGYEKSELTSGARWMYDPDWSPDGTCIAYTRDAPGPMEIHTIRSDGGEPRLVYEGAQTAEFGTWSPDGSRLLFHANPHASLDLFTMSPDGSDVRRLTKTPQADEITPAWWAPSSDGTPTPECGATE